MSLAPNERNLNCTPLEIAYHHLLNTKYGVDCDPKYTLENAYLAYRDKWAYAASVDCDPNCSLDRIIRRSTYGCVGIEECTDQTIDCMLTLDVTDSTRACKTINIIVT